MPTKYKIQCYIETLSSNNRVTLRGSEGYKLLKDDKKYLIFFEVSSNVNCRLISESNVFTIQEPPTRIQNMLLAAQINRKKVELMIEFSDDNNTKKITKVKLLQ